MFIIFLGEAFRNPITDETSFSLHDQLLERNDAAGNNQSNIGLMLYDEL